MSQFLYSLTLVFVFLASANTQITADTSPSYSKNHKMFVKTACNSTTYPDKCYKSLSSYSSTIKSDPIKLCTTALKLNVNSAKEAASVISKLLKKSQKSAAGRKNKMLPEKLILRDCLEEMRDTIVELKQAITEMKTLRDGDSVPEHMTNVRTWVSAALTDEGTCTDGFEEIKVNKETKKKVLPALIVDGSLFDGDEVLAANYGYFERHYEWNESGNRSQFSLKRGIFGLIRILSLLRFNCSRRNIELLYEKYLVIHTQNRCVLLLWIPTIVSIFYIYFDSSHALLRTLCLKGLIIKFSVKK
ncbi:unnamed protein product [Brassica rapa]|uniref:Pectinesterase inhibitor domain-containing protein n=2 Tax=Brassica TaxID=3705 RepID=A0A8D9I177_BRACM|nr:unnamed protein product [Brassica napus]CAG7909708.1 unnamed protein product [Brassica rapa]